MFCSGFDPKADVRRRVKAIRRRSRASSKSLDRNVSTESNAIPISCSHFTQFLSAYIKNPGEAQIQSSVIDEGGGCISTETSVSDIEQSMEANQESTTLSLQLVMVSRILKGMPQSPHFYHLRNHSGHTRKALISAWDRVFEEAVDQIHSLQADDFWVSARELWKTMEELQRMGYNVTPLRRRIVELSDVVTGVKSCKLEMKRLTIKAENHRAEKSRLEFEIMKLQDKMRKEEDDMNKALTRVAEMENEMPDVDVMFADIFRKPLITL